KEHGPVRRLLAALLGSFATHDRDACRELARSVLGGMFGAHANAPPPAPPMTSPDVTLAPPVEAAAAPPEHTEVHRGARAKPPLRGGGGGLLGMESPSVAAEPTPAPQAQPGTEPAAPEARYLNALIAGRSA